MSKDLWWVDYERVGEEIDRGELDRDGAITALTRLGLSRDDAAAHFDEAVS